MIQLPIITTAIGVFNELHMNVLQNKTQKQTTKVTHIIRNFGIILLPID